MNMMLITSLLVLSIEGIGSTKTCNSSLSSRGVDDNALRSERRDSITFGGAESESIFRELLLSALALGGKGLVACAGASRKKVGRVRNLDLSETLFYLALSKLHTGIYPEETVMRWKKYDRKAGQIEQGEEKCNNEAYKTAEESEFLL